MVAAMKKHYDFSKSVKNPYLSKAKKQLTIRLDEDTINYFPIEVHSTAVCRLTPSSLR
jgi:hypothetical protein